MSSEFSKNNTAFSFISDLSDTDIRLIAEIGNPILKELTFCQLNEFDSESFLVLNSPLELELDFENDLYILENELFNLFSFGKDLKESV
ncbi:hypothetical protein MmiHf6_08670 [Methanimicrococcus hongohii]|uniref:Uncharacterized protein n=1 Tax=Methanimicrococcus hongohii TaxID=3028295 RepID=A0AA97A1U9_9EURY|nr:hypothetical protein [Methanimicrococcus sp. Hf6]WNY23558.1 hypothetical protein MmiHf6_08670 [Methanimicrococcus sp. Hf6]